MTTTFQAWATQQNVSKYTVVKIVFSKPIHNRSERAVSAIYAIIPKANINDSQSQFNYLILLVNEFLTSNTFCSEMDLATELCSQSEA